MTSSLLIFALSLISLHTMAHDAKGAFVGSRQQTAYNEAERTPGELRAPYIEFMQKTGINPYPVKLEAVNQLLGMPLNDAIKILPIPAILSSDEYAFLQKGAELRAQTLTAFFADIIFNRAATVLASGILNEAQIHAIIAAENTSYNLDYLRELWQNRSISDVHFAYGPDVIRDPLGQFKVIEDNIGLIGGVGDIAPSHNAFYSVHAQNPSLQAPLVKAIETFLTDLPRDQWSEKAVMIYRQDKEESTQVKPQDEEDKRVAAIAKSLGIKIVDYSSLKNHDKELEKIVSGQYSKIINLYSIFDLPTNVATQQVAKAFRERKFELFVAPGVDVVASKATLPFIDQLTSLYMGRPAMLTSQPTEWILNSQDLKDVEAGWVVKKANGSQGSEVYILENLGHEGRKNLIHHMAEWEAYVQLKYNAVWPMFIKQQIVDPSFIPAELGGTWVKFNVDFRPHVFVSNGTPLKPAIWGRASWKIPGVLNNVSQTAMEIVITTPDQCERALMSTSVKN